MRRNFFFQSLQAGAQAGRGEGRLRDLPGRMCPGCTYMVGSAHMCGRNGAREFVCLDVLFVCLFLSLARNKLMTRERKESSLGKPPSTTLLGP